jgi:hypothetical protein
MWGSFVFFGILKELGYISVWHQTYGFKTESKELFLTFILGIVKCVMSVWYQNIKYQRLKKDTKPREIKNTKMQYVFYQKRHV